MSLPTMFRNRNPKGKDVSSSGHIPSQVTASAEGQSSLTATLETSQGQRQAQVTLVVYPKPTSFRRVSVTQTSLGCPSGTAGYGATVVYEVIDNSVNPPLVVAREGMVPKEQFSSGGGPWTPSSFTHFATPVETDSMGQFNGTSVGTCFGPPVPQTNVCVDVVQVFKIFRIPMAGDEAIDTVTTRRDCVNGKSPSVNGKHHEYAWNCELRGGY